MRKIFFLFCVLLTGLVANAQINGGTYSIKGADTVKIWKVGGTINPNSTELIIQNNTDTVPGFLWNIGFGITKFKRPLVKINDSTYLIGIDTLHTGHGGGGGGGSPGGANNYIQINEGGTFVGVSTLYFDTTKKTLVIGGLSNTIGSTATNNIASGQNNINQGVYAGTFGFSNTAGAYSYAFGNGNIVNGYSITSGNNNANTNGYSATFGNNLLNTYPNSLVIGQFNDTTAWPGAATASDITALPVLSIGNGTGNGARHNAFTVLRNGKIILNLFNNATLDSALTVDQNGNVVLKKFVSSGGGGGGTLDSVGLHMPTGFTVSNNPVTGTGGTINVTTSLNGVVHANGSGFSGGLITDADVNDVAWSKITATPTTVTGYGITNAVRSDQVYNNPTFIGQLAWSKITSTPTSLSGYGITDPVVLTSGSYANPSWITQLAWSKITSTPTTLVGYGITDNIVNSINGLTGIVVMKNADSIKHLPVDTSNNRNNYVVTFDSLNHKFYLSAINSGGGSSSFSGLTDVSVTSPTNNQIPVYVSGTGKWTNTNVTTSIIAEGSNLYWTNARFDTRFATKTTDSLPEGLNNLYFTQSRARNSVSAAPAGPITYSSSTGVFSLNIGNGLRVVGGSLLADTTTNIQNLATQGFVGRQGFITGISTLTFGIGFQAGSFNGASNVTENLDTIGTIATIYNVTHQGFKTFGVDSIWRTPGKDSLQYTINGRYHSVKDSVGTGGGSSFDSLSTQGGGWHTQNYFDIRYRKTFLDSLAAGLIKDTINVAHKGNIGGIYVSGDTIYDKGWNNTNGVAYVRTGTDSANYIVLKQRLPAGSCTNCNLTYDSTGQLLATSNGTGVTNLTLDKYVNFDTLRSSTGTPVRLDTADGTNAGLMSNYVYQLTHHLQTFRKAKFTVADSITYANVDTLFFKGLYAGIGIKHTVTQDSIIEYVDSNWIKGLAGWGGLTGAGNLNPLFTTSIVSNAIQFTPSTVSAYAFYGNATNATTTPSFSKIPYQALATSGANTVLGFDNAGNPITYTGGANIAIASGQISLASVPVLTRQNITSGTSATGSVGNLLVTFNFGSTASTFNFTMPASPTDQQVVAFKGYGTLTSGTEVTSLTITPNTGQTIIAASALTTFDVGEYALFRYDAANAVWSREQ